MKFNSLNDFFEAYDNGLYEPFNLQEEVEEIIKLVKADTLSRFNANKEFLNDMLEDSKSLIRSELIVIQYNNKTDHLECYRIDTQVVFGLPCIPQDEKVYIDKWGNIR